MANYIIENGELYHHGVKGMKWGVRRAKSFSGPRPKARTIDRVIIDEPKETKAQKMAREYKKRNGIASKPPKQIRPSEIKLGKLDNNRAVKIGKKLVDLLLGKELY